MRTVITLLLLSFSTFLSAQDTIVSKTGTSKKPSSPASLLINYSFPEAGSTLTSLKFEIYWWEYVIEKPGNIYVKNYYNDSIVQQFDVTSPNVESNANYTAITLNSLSPGIYYLQIEPGCFVNSNYEPYVATNPKGWWFIISGDDGFPLKLRSYSPGNKTFHVKKSGGKLQLNYNKFLKPITGSLTVRQFETNEAVGGVGISVKDSSVTLTTSISAGNTHCYVDIPANYFKDINGFYSDTTPGKAYWSFTTEPSPKSYTLDFTSCTLPYTSDFRNANSIGTQTWQCGGGYNNTVGAVINGNINNVPEKNRDWLITPPIDLSGMDEPMLRFYSKTQYNGMPLKLLLSSNYAGPADTAGSYTWTELNGKFPGVNSNTWTLSDSISLHYYKSRQINLCFQYNSTIDAASEWAVDSITIFNNPYKASALVSGCAGNNGISFTAGITGSTYQWQENKGSGFVNIFNTGAYSGSNTNKLQISSFPSYYNGYEYRCLINGNTYSDVQVVRVTNSWTGAISNEWENPANWSCGSVPDEYTDISISSGSPVVNSKVICRSLDVKANVNLVVNTGYTIIVRN